MKQLPLFFSIFIITILYGCGKDEMATPAPTNIEPTAFNVELPTLTFQIPTAHMGYDKMNDSINLVFSSSMFNICIWGCSGTPIPIEMDIHFEKKGTEMKGVYTFKKYWLATQPEFSKTSPPKFSLTIISGTATIDSFFVKDNGSKYVQGKMQLITWKDNDTTVVVPAKVTFSLFAVGP